MTIKGQPYTSLRVSSIPSLGLTALFSPALSLSLSFSLSLSLLPSSLFASIGISLLVHVKSHCRNITKFAFSTHPPADLSNPAFPFSTQQTIDIGCALVRATRMTYVGELGWELYVPMDMAAGVVSTLPKCVLVV